MKMIRKQTGFTLIEVMIAIAIIGILAAIAIPNYRQYVIRGNRADMQAKMMQIAAALEQYRAQQFSYKNAALSKPSIYGGSVYPLSGAVLYNLTFALTNNNTGWVLTAKATGNVQSKDGVLMLDDTGRNCWLKGTTATSCTLGDASQAWSVK